MSKTDYKGIDYGRGMSNVDGSTGIRFGVIQHDKVGQAWWEESEGNYREPACPKCEGEVVDLTDLGDECELRDEDDKLISSEEIDEWECAEHECADYACVNCRYVFGSESAISEEPYSHSYDKDGYACEQGHDDPDIFILKSPFYTWCQFCSPCAPGAGYITNWTEPGVGIKAFVFDSSWFEDNKAPYPVYWVENDSLVEV